MKSYLFIAGILLAATCFAAKPLYAEGLGQDVSAPTGLVQQMRVAQDSGGISIKPSQAAIIALESLPGSKVLSVKLLPSGEYAVTLKIGGSVQKVLVNATTGEIG